jgi:hypothetical protein
VPGKKKAQGRWSERHYRHKEMERVVLPDEPRHIRSEHPLAIALPERRNHGDVTRPAQPAGYNYRRMAIASN